MYSDIDVPPGSPKEPPQKKFYPRKIIEPKEYSADLDEGTRREEGNKRIWNMLARSIPQTGMTPPNDGRMTVLDIGCGRSGYASVLTSYFGGNDFLKNNEQVHYIGIDSYPYAIENTLVPDERNFSVYIGDIRNRNQYPAEEPQQAEVVFIGQPGPTHDPSFYQEAFSRVTANGMIVLTFMFDDDYTAFKRILDKDITGYDIIVDKETEHSEEIKNWHKHITILKPKTT